MMTLRGVMVMVLVGMAIGYMACSESTVGPNEIGGETNLELTEVGGRFSAFLSADDYNPAFDRLQDSVVVTKNENGIVTMHAKLAFDSLFVVALDSSLGTTNLPMSIKLAILDVYLERFGATLDTTNKQAMTAVFDLKMKVTSEGIQEFVNSRGDVSRPFTIVKYGAAVGDKYEFTNGDGVKITRTVTYRSTTDDYAVGFLLIKVIKVEQTQEDPLMEKITYYANHKFGLVGMVIRTKQGKEMKIGVIPPTI